jgi:hypothetical protein
MPGGLSPLCIDKYSFSSNPLIKSPLTAIMR